MTHRKAETMTQVAADKPVAKIVVVFNEKGGAGKTTTTCNLAGTLGLRGYDVLVADLDPAQSSASWLGTNGGENFKATIWPGFRYGEKVAAEFEKLVTKYDIIVVDCPPNVENPGTWASLLVADAALIPTKLGPTDINVLSAAKSLAKRAQETSGRDFPTFVIPVSVKPNLNDHKIVLSHLEADKRFPCIMHEVEEQVKNANGKGTHTVKKLAALSLGERIAFTRCMLVGGTAHAMRNANEAIAEIETLADATLTMVNLPLHPAENMTAA